MKAPSLSELQGSSASALLWQAGLLPSCAAGQSLPSFKEAVGYGMEECVFLALLW